MILNSYTQTDNRESVSRCSGYDGIEQSSGEFCLANSAGPDTEIPCNSQVMLFTCFYVIIRGHSAANGTR